MGDAAVSNDPGTVRGERGLGIGAGMTLLNTSRNPSGVPIILEDIFGWVREGNAFQVRLWCDNTEHDLNQGFVSLSPSHSHLLLLNLSVAFCALDLDAKLALQTRVFSQALPGLRTGGLVALFVCQESVSLEGGR